MDLSFWCEDVKGQALKFADTELLLQRNLLLAQYYHIVSNIICLLIIKEEFKADQLALFYENSIWCLSISFIFFFTFVMIVDLQLRKMSHVSKTEFCFVLHFFFQHLEANCPF